MAASASAAAVSIAVWLRDDGNTIKTWSTRGKDNARWHMLNAIQNIDWKLIRVNDFSSFIHHISTVNNAQIIKRNVSVSFHSISAIRWHYCRARTNWFNRNRHSTHFFTLLLTFFHSLSLSILFSNFPSFSFFSLTRFAVFRRCIAEREKKKKRENISIRCHFDGTEARYRNIEQQIEHKQQSACRVKRYQDTDRNEEAREGGNNILWITITCFVI